MGDRIALGFHACVDFELKWDREKVEEIIQYYDIREEELKAELHIDSERNLLIACLAHMREGTGAEFVPETSEICYNFAQNFEYEVTVGGTAARAAMAISKLGYESALSMVCFNQHIRDRMPEQVHYYSNVPENNEKIYPHVAFSYPAGEHIQTGGIDFVTPRENRLLFSRDEDSLKMVISQGFAPMLEDAEVMLLSCFSEVLDQQILEARMEELNRLLESLPESAYVVFEDGCYVKKDFQTYVHRALHEKLDALSMNEDEMQEYIGRRIDIMEPQEVLDGLEYIYRRLEVPLLIVHSASWAIAYGSGAKTMGHVLEGGILTAATRFQYGDDFGPGEYQATAKLLDKQGSVRFGEKITELSERDICCVACKDLSFVEHPVVVGLGDYFAGGLLPELTLEKRGLEKRNDRKEG